MVGDAIVMPLAADTQRTDTAERLGLLFDTHYRRLYNLARRMTRSADEARDAVQDTFLRAARSRNRFRTALHTRKPGWSGS